MNEEAVSAIIEYVDEFLSVPKIKWPERLFNSRAYSRWAAYELVYLIMDHPFSYPEEIIEDFIFKMECFYRFCEDEKRRFIFSEASDTAEAILALIRTGKEY